MLSSLVAIVRETAIFFSTKKFLLGIDCLRLTFIIITFIVVMLTDNDTQTALDSCAQFTLGYFALCIEALKDFILFFFFECK